MLYRIFDDMSQCSEQEIARLLPIVSLQRREQALRFSHTFGRYCCLKSYEILMELLQEWGTDTLQELTPEFLYNEYGAPYLLNGPFFSISHCKQGIAIVISDTPVGIDIEGLRKVDEGLIRKTMNAEEQMQIYSSAAPEIEFIRLWTRKEAFVKMQGTGIISDMHTILSDISRIHWTEYTNIDKGYIYSICKKDIP